MLFRKVNTKSIIESKTESKIYGIVKKLTKVVGLVLAITMLLTSIQFNNLIILARQNNVNNEDINFKENFDMDEVRIDYEVKDKRNKYTKHFRKKDGTNEMAVYNEAVHYFDGQEWKDIDNNLNYMSSTDEYENKANSFKIKLPKKIQENKKFKLTAGDYKVVWSINNINKSEINIIEGISENTNNLKEAKSVNQRVIYNDIFNNVDLEYIIKGEAIKENVILNQYVKDFSLSFTFNVDNLALVEENGEYYFVNKDKETIFTLGSFFMYDSIGRISYDVDVIVTNGKKGVYNLEVKPNDEWLSQNEIVYPVVIDPTIRITNYDVNQPIRDGYVREGQTGMANNEIEFLYTGNVSGDINRSYIEFNLEEITQLKDITYAKLNLYTGTKDDKTGAFYKPKGEYGSNFYINLREVENGYYYSSISSIGNPPPIAKTVKDSDGFSVGSQVKGTVRIDARLEYTEYILFTYDLTKMVKEWVSNDDSKRIIELLSSNEDIENYTLFDSSEYTYKPSMEIGYVDAGGLADYYTYHNQSIGVGEGYTNDYTGNLTYIYPDNTPIGEGFGINIAHVFDTTIQDIDNGYGKGWNINYDRQASTEVIDGQWYVKLTDSTGEILYFNEIDCSVVDVVTNGTDRTCGIAEDGSGQIAINDNITDYIKIKSPDGLSTTYWMYEDQGHEYRKNIIRDLKTDKEVVVYFQTDNTDYINIITDELGNKAEFKYVNNRLEEIHVFSKDTSGVYELVEIVQYKYDTSDHLTNIINIPRNLIEYKKQIYNRQSSYTWSYYNLMTSYFTNSYSSNTIYDGEYKYSFGSTTQENYYKYGMHEYYDKIGFKIYKKNSEFWLSDVYLGTHYVWIDESPSLLDDADYFEKKYYYTTGDIDPLKKEYYGNSFTHLGRTVYLNDRNGVSDDQYFVKYTDIYEDSTYNPFASSTSKIGWTSSSFNDYKSGDYRKIHYKSSVDWTDFYGNNKYSSTRYKSTASVYKKTYHAAWEDSSPLEVKYFKDLPDPETDVRWVLIDQTNTNNIESQVTFTYTGDKLLTASNFYDDKIKYYYTGNKVNKIQQLAPNNDVLSTLNITYKTNKTIFEDDEGDRVSYLIDYYGHTINVTDNEGNAIFYEYANIGTILSNWNMNNKVLSVSRVQSNNLNYLQNPSFERSGEWSKTTNYTGGYESVGVIQEEEGGNYGKFSCRITKTVDVADEQDDLYRFQQVYLDPATYTYAIYVNSEELDPDSSAFISYSIYDANNNIIDSNLTNIENRDGWARYDLTFTVDTENTKVKVRAGLNTSAIGTIYLDHATLSKDYIETRYNYVDNATFETNDLDAWVNNNDFYDTTPFTTTTDMKDIIGDYVVKVIGSPSAEKSLTQDIFFNEDGKIGDEFVFGGWAKGYATPVDGHNPNYGIELIFYNDGLTTGDTAYLPFNTQVIDWQYFMTNTVTTKVYDQIKVKLIYKGSNDVYFDNIQLYKDQFGTSYTHYSQSLLDTKYTYYHKTGNIATKTDSTGTYKYYYDENDLQRLVKVTRLKEGGEEEQIVLAYDSYGKVTTTTQNNVVTTFAYDDPASQKVTSITIGDTGNYFTTSTLYTPIGYFTDEVTDEFGNTVDYNYNVITGLLESVEDQEGFEVSYVYDDYGRLIKVAKDSSNNKYYYVDGRLDKIVVNEGTSTQVQYDFIYDSKGYGNITEIKVAGQTLMKYDYLDEKKGQINYQEYGNGNIVKFKYDENDLVTQIIFKEDISAAEVIKYEYKYDKNGYLYQYIDRTIDYFNPVIHTYDYDLQGRIRKVIDNEGNTFDYQYDDQGSLSGYIMNLNGVTQEITYNFDHTTGLYEDTTLKINGSQTISKDFIYDTNDALKRLQKVNLIAGDLSNPNAPKIYEQSFSYVDNNEVVNPVVNGNSSTRVKTLEYVLGGDTANKIVYSYKYDKRGNITDIEVTKGIAVIEKYHYEYDALNQLIREDVDVEGTIIDFTRVYKYDNNGNIEFKVKTTSVSTETTEKLLQSTSGKISYDYNNAWKDQLSSYNGETILYDNTGNPVKIGNHITLEWEGRQLIKYTDTIQNLVIEYKYNDQGYRTRKIVTKDGQTTTIDYILDGSQVVQEKIDGQIIDYFYDFDGKLIGFKYNNVNYYYIRNLQGDITKIIDESSSIMVEYTYDAWGNIVSQTDNELAKINPYRYRGYRYDEDTSVYYLNSRYYNAEWGRFINADGLIGETGEILGHNMYAYCSNNPVMMVDPSGYLSFGQVLTVVAIVAIAIFTVTAIVATAGGAAALAGAMAGAYLGAGAVTAASYAALGGGLLLAGGTLAVGLNRASEQITGENWIADNVFDGNENTYAFVEATLAATTASYINFGSMGVPLTSQCFVAGTLIKSANGDEPIENINLGDLVYAEDPETGEKGLKKVVRTFENKTNELVHVLVNNEIITATAEHPFYIPQKGWTEAAKLKAGDELVLVNGDIVIIEFVQHEILETPVKVYNFEVEDFHTYYVSESGVLVHNTCMSRQEMNKIKQKIMKSDDYTFKNKKQAEYFISQKFRDFSMDKAQARSANGWHYDSHVIDGMGPNSIEHINIYGKNPRFRSHIFWKD